MIKNLPVLRVLVVVLVSHSCLTLCNPTDYSLPGSSVHGTLKARILEWIVIPSPEDLPDPGIESRSPALQTDSLPSELQGKFSWMNHHIFLYSH